jgi:hypothetical protein
MLLVLNIVPWGGWVTVAAFAYFAVVFTIFQILYNIGAKKQALKLRAKAAEAKTA